MADAANADPLGAALSKLRDLRLTSDYSESLVSKEYIGVGSPFTDFHPLATRSSSVTSCSIGVASPHSVIRDNAPITPRRYIKAILSMLQLISKHKALFTDAVREALQNLNVCIEQSSLLYGNVDGVKLYCFLREDVLLQQLQDSAYGLKLAIQQLQQGLDDQHGSAKAELQDAVQKVAHVRSEVPQYQQQLIVAFDNLAKQASTLSEPSSEVQQAADVIMREAIQQTYGPAWSEQVLDKELEHLDVRLRQPAVSSSPEEAVFVRLMAEALMKVDEWGGQGSDGEGGEDVDLFDLQVTSSKPDSGKQTAMVIINGLQNSSQSPSLLSTRSSIHSDDSSSSSSSSSPPAPQADGQFMGFLDSHQGDPHASMFHAQMRLSLEGLTRLAAFIKESGRVRALSLSHNWIGDDGLAVLCGAISERPTVTSLDVPDNHITDEGACALAALLRDNSSLTELQLGSNSIGDRGAAALAEALQHNSALVTLGLANNNIGPEGCSALAQAVNGHRCLKAVEVLPGNCLGPKDAKALARAVKRHGRFNISWKSLLGLHRTGSKEKN